MRCHFCGEEMSEEEEYCPHCGMKNEAPSFDEINETNKKKRKNRNVWIVLICIILILSVIRIGFNDSVLEITTQTPSSSLYDYKDLDHVLIKEQSEATIISNLNAGGYICQDGTYIYMSDNAGNIVRFDDQMLKNEQIYAGQCSYLQVHDNYLYFKDNAKDDGYYRMDLTTNEVVELIETDVYYPYVVGEMIYYQNDPDNESLYVYDMTAATNTKLNDEASYNIQVVDNVIYYTTYEAIKSIDLNTQEEKTILNAPSLNLVIDGTNLYYISQQDYYMYRYDLNQADLTTTRLNREYTLSFVIDGENIYYLNDSYQVINMKTNGLDNQLLNDQMMGEYLQIMGDYLLFQGSESYGDTSWYRMDVNGENGHYVFSQKFGNYV